MGKQKQRQRQATLYEDVRSALETIRKGVGSIARTAVEHAPGLRFILFLSAGLMLFLLYGLAHYGLVFALPLLGLVAAIVSVLFQAKNT